MEGSVFEIQKFGLNDGPGIRTVVFLKGCALKCEWCSNPESINSKLQLSFNKDKCVNCKDCIPVCPENAILFSKENIEIDFKNCTACGLCIPSCGYNALKIHGWKTEATTIIDEVMKDVKYFDKSGGGITLSGGEPLTQPKFAFELLSLAKTKKLHTCLQSTGFTTLDNFKRILPLVDILLFDYKMSDDNLHIKYTGGSQKKILINLDYAYTQGKSIVLRCVIIPGINDTITHFKAIAQLNKKYPDLKGIEIMPYHDWGSHKYKQLGMKPYTIKASTVEEKLVEKWLKTLKKLGCEKIKKG